MTKEDKGAFKRTYVETWDHPKVGGACRTRPECPYGSVGPEGFRDSRTICLRCEADIAAEYRKTHEREIAERRKQRRAELKQRDETIKEILVMFVNLYPEEHPLREDLFACVHAVFADKGLLDGELPKWALKLFPPAPESPTRRAIVESYARWGGAMIQTKMFHGRMGDRESGGKREIEDSYTDI